MKRVSTISTGIIFLVIILAFSSCKKDENNNNQTINGYVQKGPFINGSSVTMFDLQSDFTPTGKSYNSQITDNNGTFQVNAASLSSNYVNLRADGFYFNEVLGQQSFSQISLYACCDISKKTDININVLTHLEKSRVEYLINSGKTFEDAKVQAQKEVLAIFNIEKNDIQTSENLDISESGDDNGILLAISVILQGNNSESQLIELLANISNDIQEDGVLNSDTLGSKLVTQARLLDTITIANNITERYNEIGSEANISSFGKYITNFIAQTSFTSNQSLFVYFAYPKHGDYGINILSDSTTTFYSDSTFSLFADLSLTQPSLKIKITSESNSDQTNTIPTWQYQDNESNWLISEFDSVNYSQTFSAVREEYNYDLEIHFDKGTFLIEYFEMNAATPTRSKTITIN
ncbi:MAG: hypothetical protein R6U95_08635 [Bacteroidales bacterium]